MIFLSALYTTKVKVVLKRTMGVIPDQGARFQGLLYFCGYGAGRFDLFDHWLRPQLGETKASIRRLVETPIRRSPLSEHLIEGLRRMDAVDRADLRPQLIHRLLFAAGIAQDRPCRLQSVRLFRPVDVSLGERRYRFRPIK